MNDVLSALECDFLWESFGAGDLPYPLELRSHGETVDERAALRERTLTELAQRGIVQPDGDLHPRIAGQFEVLAGAEVSVDSVYLAELSSPSVRVLAGALEDRGALAVQDADGLRISEIPADALASTIVGLLPSGARGTERSVTLPMEQLMSGAGADFLRRKGNGAGSSPADTDMKILARLQAQPRLRGGQIAANRCSELGVRSRSSVLSWFDTASGRYLTRCSTGADGREWVAIAPADAATLRHSIGEMLGRVRSSS